MPEGQNVHQTGVKKLKQVINAIDPTLKSLRILLQFIFLLNCVCNLFLNITYDAFFSCICCK